MNTTKASGPILYACDIQGDAISAHCVRFESYEMSRAEFDERTFQIFDSSDPAAETIANLVAESHRDSGAWDIARERRRQIEVEGWSEANDDDHLEGELATAARCYLQVAEMQAKHGREAIPVHYEWPWTRVWWKPSDDPIRNLEKAGALMAAEIDRLKRARVHGAGEN